jgi:hypothetical protein
MKTGNGSPVVKRSITFAGHRTSVSLEDEFWTGLKEIAAGRDMTLSYLVATIDSERQHCHANPLVIEEHFDTGSSDTVICRTAIRFVAAARLSKVIH